MTARLLTRFRHFLGDRRGSVSAEALIVLPLVLWAYLATYQYYDAFGTITRNMQATYTIADAISRQTDNVSQTTANGMNALYAYLNKNPQGTWTRITEVSWDPNVGSSGQYYVMGGCVTGNNPLLDDNSLQAYTSRLPTIADGDTLIMVETHMNYTPAFSLVGLKPMIFNQLVVTRPRISPQVVFDDTCGAS